MSETEKKKVYIPPELIKLGKIEDVTQGVQFLVLDAMGTGSLL